MKKVLSKRSEASLPVWERGMNAEQLEAINHGHGPLRLLAAAGSGKTRVVVHRIMRLVQAEHVDPGAILAVTFSKKAALEMNDRLEQLGCEGARVGTWHSLCLQILREDRTEEGSWTIEDSGRGTSTKPILKDVLGYRGMNWAGADFNAIKSFIGKCKANLFDPDSQGAKDLATQIFRFNAGRACEAFDRYNCQIREKCLLTFDDYLVFTAKHLENEDTRRAWASRWDYLIQDEAQDANFAQKTIANLLARDHQNYMAVGDVFQAIYGFRGSTPAFLADFESEWTDAKTIWLGRNYRSGAKIIDAANGIVRPARVPGYEPRDMIASRGVDGTAVAHVSEDLDGEAVSFVTWVKELTRTGENTYGDITALFRTNAQSRALEEQLLGARIPYVVVGGTSFYERTEVRALLGYLRVAAECGEIEDIKRCINAPFRFLGHAFVDRVMAAADGGADINWTLLVDRVAQQAGLQARQRASAADWCRLIDDASERIRIAQRPNASEAEKDRARPTTILGDIVRVTRFIEWLTKEEGEESIESSGAANIREMIRVAARFPTVRELIAYVDGTIRAAKKQREGGQAGGDRVLLMSVHRSKGLEWPHVWVSGFNEMILPHVRGDEEEERRIAYVAATRARDSLVLSYVRTLATRAGIKDAQPSRFLRDTGLIEPDQDPHNGAEIREMEDLADHP